jgi:hypothetical protein
MTAPRLEIHYDTTHGEWAALYVNGQLDRVGDNFYLTEERAFELAGITVVHDGAFMRGQTQADGVAQTLDEVAAYRQQRDAARAEAQRLRDEAARLTAEAARLEGGSR